MKNILIFVKNLSSGGAEKQSILLAKALDKTYNVHYVILNAKYQEQKYIKLLSENSTIKITSFNGNIWSRFNQFCSYLRTQKIDYIFSYLTAANFFAIVASRLTSTQYVFTGIRNAYLPPLKAFVDRTLCNRFATAAVLNCYSGKQYFLGKRFSKEKMVVIPNCFENIKPFKLRSNSGFTNKIISVGRFVVQKDYFTALDIVSYLRKQDVDIIYQIVGFGDLEQDIRERIKILGLENCVEVYINPPNISELLDQADIYLSTSIFEGTSNSIMEAMNADLPIIATNVGDNSKLVLHNKNGFVAEIKDVVTMSEFVMTLVNDSEIRHQMGEKSKQHLLDHYSVDHFETRYRKLIQD